MVCAVIGATGFIGRHLVNSLAQAGYRVRAISRRPSGHDFEHPAVEQIRADIHDAVRMTQALEGVDTVFQLVSGITPSVGNQQILRDLEQEVTPQIRFMEVCVIAGVQRLVFASSGGAIYGDQPMGPIRETALPSPKSSYGATKLAVEHYLNLFSTSYDMECVSLRISNPYGPGQVFRKGQGLIPAVLKRASEGELVNVFGDGTRRRDYIYVDDLTDAMLRVARHSDWMPPVINIGGGMSVSINEILEAIEAIIGYPIPRHHVESRSTDAADILLDIQTARDLLNWTPTTSLADGLRKTVSAYCLGSSNLIAE